MQSLRTAFLAVAVSSLVLGAPPATADTAVSGIARITLHVEGMTCPACKAAVKTVLVRLPGVTDAKVDVETKTATVEYDASRVSPQTMVEAVNRLGYEASLPANAGPPPHATRPGAPPEIEARAVKVGAPAPAFSLPAADGGRWTLKDALARGPVVLVFNRGDW
jgi:copper chaperone CopZ